MDDMLFECKKNAIYVLNTNYAYGEFGRLNLFGAPTTINNVSCEAKNGKVEQRSSRNTPSNYSGDCLHRSSSATLVSSNHTTEVPHLSATERTTSTATTTSTRTIPKLFHYSPNQHSDHLLQNHIPNPHHSLHALPYDSQQQQQFPSSGVTSSTVAPATTTSSSSFSKKSSNLKSTIIAKKTKFWKYLEEEKWKKSTSVGNLTTTNCERNSDGSLMKNNGGMINNMSSTANNSNSSCNNNNNGRRNSRTSGDSGSQKSSTELYKEAAELLGLSCTLCDNCRCLDCQSRYFECDDSDSYSELSFLGDCFDTFDSHLQNTRNCQQYSVSNNTECQSIQSDNSSICSANSNHSDSP
ncbi:unnamed protein product [Hermetia illucens]|uniref:DUF4802 domain-containing protein n=2 Tax=Hermetia illucens TaxID=343691 RepID=A0A7R8YLX7_HERIL|nr:unnamed protein product [Hermetia illucens]